MKLKQLLSAILALVMLSSCMAVFAQEAANVLAEEPAAQTEIQEEIIEEEPASSEEAASIEEPATPEEIVPSSEPVSSDEDSQDAEVTIVSEEAAVEADSIDENAVDADITYDATSGVEGFVARMYDTTLGRDPSPEGEYDHEGYLKWVNYLKSGKITGAETMKSFLTSPEYVAKNKSNEAFVTDLYHAVFDREPDAGGFASWVGALDNLMSRDFAITGFANGVEFTELCKTYGVVRGTLTVTEERDKNMETTEFLTRLYRTALERDPDIPGLNAWAAYLNNKVMGGADVVANTFTSTEYMSKGKTNEQFLIQMYRVMFDREPDAAGLQTWITYMNETGMSFTSAINGFAGGVEFAAVCKKYNITPGKVTIKENRDQNLSVSKYVQTFYRFLCGRFGTPDELNSYTGALNSNQKTASNLVKEFTLSTECQNYLNGLGRPAAVQAMYTAFFGRAANTTEENAGMNALVTQSYWGYAQTLLKTAEFSTYARNQQVNPGGEYGNLKVTDTSGAVHDEDLVSTLAHIVAGEVGTMANAEVFKAQAIAAHSWILFKHNNGDAAPTVSWGTPSQTIIDCVTQVANQVVYYNGKPAMTTYFASCKNATNSALEVWGNDVPYLRTVASSNDSAVATHWEYSINLNIAQMQSILNKIYYSDTHGNPKYFANRHGQWATVASVDSANGYVHKVKSEIEWYNDDTKKWYTSYDVSGLYFMEKANQVGIALRSPNFTIKYNNNYTWTITTYGYGHGVGMSQWGAYGYATREGWNYDTILKHYYPGTTINSI